MSIVFDMYGNIIPSKVNKKQKLTDEQKEIIKDVKAKHNTDIDNETRSFYCIEHNRFHKHLYKGKPSQTYLKCLKSGNILKFKDDFSTSELFRMNFSKKWNQDNADYYKKEKKVKKVIQECLKSDYCKAYECKDYENDDFRCEVSKECNDFIPKSN